MDQNISYLERMPKYGRANNSVNFYPIKKTLFMFSGD